MYLEHDAELLHKHMQEESDNVFINMYDEPDDMPLMCDVCGSYYSTPRC